MRNLNKIRKKPIKFLKKTVFKDQILHTQLVKLYQRIVRQYRKKLLLWCQSYKIPIFFRHFCQELGTYLVLKDEKYFSFQVANLAANHQANDLILVEGAEQIIHARFCYGPMDLVALSYENVLVYVLPSGGDWHLRGVETTDKNGRLSINLDRELPIGMHNVRLIVQGDRKLGLV